MELTCFQENLNSGLATVGRAVATRSNLPITQNILLDAEDGRLKLVATNLEIAISCWVGAKVQDKGAITVPAELLTEFINSLPSDGVNMKLYPATKRMGVKCARYEANFSGVDAAEFPPIPTIEKGITTKINVEQFKQGIRQVIIAAFTQDSRPMLTGINVVIDKGKMKLAAADGYRLAVFTMPVPDVKETLEVTIPAKTMGEVVRIMKEEEDIEVTMGPAKSLVTFRVKNIEITSQLLQGTFPKYEGLIPKKYETRVIVNRLEFERAVNAAYVFCRAASGIIRLRITAGSENMVGKMSVEARSEEIGDDIGEIDATVEGNDAKVAFNGLLLKEALGAVKGDQVSLETSGPSTPGVFRVVGQDNYLMVVMPMFDQW